MTFTGFPTPYGTRDPAIIALSRFGRDRQTGLTTTALTLPNAPVDGTLQLFKNGTLLDESVAFTVAGAVVTLGVAAIAGDVFHSFFYYRQAQ
jgi:hypothetical protein